jgi:hypothetical protein
MSSITNWPILVLGLGSGSCSFPKRSNFSIGNGWLVTTRCLLFLCLIIVYKKMNHSPIRVRCGLQDETFLHCVCDCNFSRNLWIHLGFSNVDFFSIMDTHDWLKIGSLGPEAFTFSAGVW